jgi:hypothetical protein
MPMAEMALKSAVFAEFRPPILLGVSRARFWGNNPAVFRRACARTGAGRDVPKILELGTTGYPPAMWEKPRKTCPSTVS